MMQHIFIVGAKGIPAAYGGFETFVEKLTAYRKSKDICYHVSRISDHDGEYEYNGAKCFDVKVPELGAAKAIWYDVKALRRSIRICREQVMSCDESEEGALSRPVFYVLACRIGPFARYFARKIHKLGGKLYVNPDGHEWMRSKWSAPVRAYWKFSERLMVKHADLLVCDSRNIELYIQREYKAYKPNTTFIAYGSDTSASVLASDAESFVEWMNRWQLTAGEYYLVVGRFVPENNYETMIREFMKSDTSRDLAIVTTDNPKLHQELEAKLHISSDPRIKFVGTVYDGELLKKIREEAYGYFHGHEVGGTNPSLLEALGSTRLNLLLDVGFNREVGLDGALYWDKTEGNLASLIERADGLSEDEKASYEAAAKARIRDVYSWDFIVERYEHCFVQESR